MNCAIATQTADYANADNFVAVEDALNEYALIELFSEKQAEFSNGSIDLIDVIDRAILDDDSFITETLAEIANDKHSEKTHKSLRRLLKKRFESTALEINKENSE